MLRRGHAKQVGVARADGINALLAGGFLNGTLLGADAENVTMFLIGNTAINDTYLVIEAFLGEVFLSFLNLHILALADCNIHSATNFW